MWRPRKKIQALQDLKGLKQTLIFQDLDFQKSRCRLNGRVFKSLITGLMHTSYIYRVHSGNQVQCQYFEESPKSQATILGVMSYNVTKLTTQVMLLVYYCGGHHSNPLGRVWLTC